MSWVERLYKDLIECGRARLNCCHVSSLYWLGKTLCPPGCLVKSDIKVPLCAAIFWLRIVALQCVHAGKVFCGLHVAHVHIICPVHDVTHVRKCTRPSPATVLRVTGSWARASEDLRMWLYIYVPVSCRNQTLFYHVWQSRVKLEDSYFDHIAALNEPYCWTSIKGIKVLDIHASTNHVQVPPLMEVRQYGVLNTAMRSKNVTDDLRFLHKTVTCVLITSYHIWSAIPLNSIKGRAYTCTMKHLYLCLGAWQSLAYLGQ